MRLCFIALCLVVSTAACAAETPAVATLVTPVVASAPAATASAAGVPAGVGAPLVFFNRTVFVFRSAALGISPQDRAARALTRIQDQLARQGDHIVSLLPAPQSGMGWQVQIDGATSFHVTEGDLNPTREDNMEQTAGLAKAALTQAIAESAEGRNLDAILRALARVLLATLCMAAAVWAAGRMRRATSRWLLKVAEQHTGRLQLAGVVVLHRERMASAVRWVMVLLFRVLVLVLLSEWLSFVLRAFPYTRTWGESLNAFLLGLLVKLLSSAAAAVPELVAAVLIFAVAALVTRALDRLFTKVQAGQLQLDWLDADMALPTQRIVRVLIWVFALAMAYPYLPGSQTEAFKGLSVLIGLMLSLGASSLVGQAASGLILTYGRAYRKGDFVRIGEHEGTVTEVGMFTTRIRTGLGEELTLSNASILAGTTKNYSRAVQGLGFVLDTTLTIGYDTPWRQVHALLLLAAQRTEGILSDPAPQVFQTALSDWYPQYRLVCQAMPTEPRPRAVLLSALHANIQDVFNEYGVQIMSPQYFEDPREPKVVPPSKWYEAPASRP